MLNRYMPNWLAVGVPLKLFSHEFVPTLVLHDQATFFSVMVSGKPSIKKGRKMQSGHARL